MIETLQDFAQSFPGWLQWLAVAIVAMIPFVESYTGTLIGVAIGLPAPIAGTAAIAGNAASVLAVVLITGRIRDRVRARGDSAGRPGTTKVRQRLRRLFERFGIPGVALLGHPTQISAAAMVGFGADRTRVIVWELVSVTAWGALVAVLAGLSIALLP